MALPVYEFKRPSDGKVFKWHPLLVTDEIDIEGAYAAPSMKHLVKYALAAARIYADESKSKGYDLGELRQWESDDLGAFIVHFIEVEAQRSAAMKKPGSAPDAVYALEKAVGELRVAQSAVMGALEQAVAAARAANRPLDT